MALDKQKAETVKITKVKEIDTTREREIELEKGMARGKEIGIEIEIEIKNQIGKQRSKDGESESKRKIEIERDKEKEKVVEEEVVEEEKMLFMNIVSQKEIDMYEVEKEVEIDGDDYYETEEDDEEEERNVIYNENNFIITTNKKDGNNNENDDDDDSVFFKNTIESISKSNLNLKLKLKSAVEFTEKLQFPSNLPILNSSSELTPRDNIATEHSLDLLEHSFTSTGTADTSVVLDSSSDNGFLSNIVKKQNFDSSPSPLQNRNNDENESESENGRNKFLSLESGSRVRGSLLPKGVTFSFASSMRENQENNILCSPPPGNVLKRDREHSSLSSSYLSQTIPIIKLKPTSSLHSLFCASPLQPSVPSGIGRDSMNSTAFTPSSSSSSSSSFTPNRSNFGATTGTNSILFFIPNFVI